MDLLFAATDPETALAGAFVGEAVRLGGVLPTPHLEQLAQIALGRSVPLQTAGFVSLTAFTDPNSPGSGGPNVQQVPDSLRDLIADVAITAETAERWSAELWGVGPEQAFEIGTQVVALSRGARAADQHLYWSFTY